MDESNVLCVICLEQLPTDGDFVKCYGFCKGSFHYGCTTIKKATYKQMSSEKKIAWKCSNCRRENPEKNETQYNKLFNLLTEKLNIIEELRKDIIDLKLNVEKSVERQDLLFEKYNHLLLSVEKNKSFMGGLQTEIDVIKCDNGKKEKEILDLSKRVNYLEQKEVMNTIEICGVEKISGEKVENIFSKIVEKLDLKEIEGSVISINRIDGQEENNKIMPILVNFKNKRSKDLIINKKKTVVIKNLEIIEVCEKPESKVFINEHLTAFKRNLFWRARNKAKENNYRFIWTKNGNIYVKKRENDVVLKILCLEDLNRII